MTIIEVMDAFVRPDEVLSVSPTQIDAHSEYRASYGFTIHFINGQKIFLAGKMTDNAEENKKTMEVINEKRIKFIDDWRFAVINV